MANKGQRSYKLSIEKENGEILEVTNPFTLEFEILRNTLSSVNTATIKVYNLSKQSRNHIRRDQFDFGVVKKVKLEAGYGSELSVIYQGTIYRAQSVRQGVNFITTIESQDGGWAAVNSKYSQQFPAGTSNADIVNSVVEQLKKDGISTGAISPLAGEIPRGNSYSGSTLEVLSQVTGDGFFIDNEAVNVLGDKECIEGNVLVISSASGLLGTPTKENLFVSFDILLESRLKIGQRIKLESVTVDDDINTEYKVMAVTHKGTISEAVSGQCITSVKCLPGDFTGVVVEGGVRINL